MEKVSSLSYGEFGSSEFNEHVDVLLDILKQLNTIQSLPSCFGAKGTPLKILEDIMRPRSVLEKR